MVWCDPWRWTERLYGGTVGQHITATEEMDTITLLRPPTRLKQRRCPLLAQGVGSPPLQHPPQPLARGSPVLHRLPPALPVLAQDVRVMGALKQSRGPKKRGRIVKGSGCWGSSTRLRTKSFLIGSAGLKDGLQYLSFYYRWCCCKAV